MELYNTGGILYPKLEREYDVNRSMINGRAKQFSPIKASEDETITLKQFFNVYKDMDKEIYEKYALGEK